MYKEAEWYHGDLCDSLHKPLTEDAHFPLPKNVHKEMAIMLSSGIIPKTFCVCSVSSVVGEEFDVFRFSRHYAT